MKKAFVNKAYSFEEAEKFDVWFWHRAGVGARFSAAWSMVLDYLKIKGHRGNQPRLRRTLQKIKRA